MMYFGRGFGSFGGGCFGYGSPFWGIGGILMFAVCALLVALVVIVVMRALKKSGRLHPSSGAMETLRQRYAKGEISEEEYLRIKKTLEQ